MILDTDIGTDIDDSWALAYLLRCPGLDLKLAYDFYDPSIDLKSGANSRYTAGVEFFPLPGVEVRPLYRFVRETPVEVRNNEFDIVLHCYI